jgi:hypothetical protein
MVRRRGDRQSRGPRVHEFSRYRQSSALGANFSDGISAIEELPCKIQAIHALTDLELYVQAAADTPLSNLRRVHRRLRGLRIYRRIRRGDDLRGRAGRR